MRRIIALLVISALGLPLLAVNLGNTAIASGSQSLTRYQFAHEVSDIATNSAVSCYVNSLWGVTFTAGAGTNTMDASSITTWANLRLEGMAEEEYATKYLGFQLTDSTFNAALANLSNQMMAAAAASGVNCGVDAQKALLDLPSGLAGNLIRAQAASGFLASKLPARIDESPASLQAFYAAHQSEYDTICVSVALVVPTDVAAFQADRAAGMSVAELATKYSHDASAAAGGAYGCFDATSNARDLTRGVALNTYSAGSSVQNGMYVLFVAPTKRTPAPYEKVASQVLTDVRNVNSGSIEAAKQGIYSRVGVLVSPVVGRYGTGAQGIGVYPPAAPASTLLNTFGLDSTTAIHF